MFRYEYAYIADPANRPLSLRLPVDAGEHEISRWLDGLLLDGLLPDNPGAHTRWAAQQQAAAPDAMSLLSTPHRPRLHRAGAVQFCLPGHEDANRGPQLRHRLAHRRTDRFLDPQSQARPARTSGEPHPLGRSAFGRIVRTGYGQGHS